jgi:excisionase family DNA binding protein
METVPFNHSPAEAADIFGIGRSTLYKLIAEGRLSVIKIGRSTKVPHTELVRLQQELLDEAKNRV